MMTWVNHYKQLRREAEYKVLYAKIGFRLHLFERAANKEMNLIELIIYKLKRRFR
jgi:hypothetical protein